MSLGKGLEGFDLSAVLGSFDGSHDELLKEFVRELDHERLLISYIRKSNPTGHERSANYLREQELMPSKIIAAGFPSERVVTKMGDTGLSGALPRQFRSDLDETFKLIGEGVVGAIASADVARWFRDPSLKAPTEFVQRAGRHKVRLITHIRGKLTLLRLEEKAARELFVREAEAAAFHRDKIREVTNSAKRQSAARGDYTGGACPLGWRVEPGRSKFETETGEGTSSRQVPYPPHADVKMTIMQASLLPHIRSYSSLRRHLIEHEVIIPPFEKEYRAYNFSRSVLRHVYTKTSKGRVYLQQDESLVPSARMLRNILLEPLAVGVKLYGSGDGGMYALRRYLNRAEKTDTVPDCQILPIRLCVGTFAEQALCHTQEQIDLYRQVCQKWAKVDLNISWELHQRTDQLALNPAQAAGKPTGPPRGSSRINPWAGHVLCGRHGLDDDGTPHESRHLRLSGDQRTWQCTFQYDKQETDRLCCNWGDKNILGRVLDTHLLRGIEYALRHDSAFIRSVATGESVSERKMRLVEEVREAQVAYETERDAASKIRLMWEGIDTAMAATETQRFLELHVKPLAAIYAEKKKELAKLDHIEGASATGTEQEVTEALRFALANWDSLTTERKSHIIALLVSRVVVQVTDGAECREGLIYFTWANGVTDRLVSWRGWFLDTREWSEDEDNALRELWATDCSWQEITIRLQPYRRLNKTRRHATELGVTSKGGRSRKWMEDARNSERAWNDHNPDVLYLQLEPGESPRECLAVTDLEKCEVISIPESVSDGVQFTLSECASKTKAGPLFP